MLRGLRSQDARQWHRMAVIYVPLVSHWCRKAGARTDDCDDIVQEVFRTVSARIGEFRRERPGAFHRWLWTITRHKLGDYFRKMKATPLAIGGADFMHELQMIADADEPPFEDAPNGLAGVCRRALNLIRNEFEETTWQAFWRAVVDEQNPAHIAADLGISVNAVYLAKSRILRRLRAELGDMEAS